MHIEFFDQCALNCDQLKSALRVYINTTVTSDVDLTHFETKIYK